MYLTYLRSNLLEKYFREIFKEKIESEGEIDTLCFQVSISQEITSSEYSFKEIKKAAGFGKKLAADIYVKELLGDRFIVVATNKPRYLYYEGIKRNNISPTKKVPLHYNLRTKAKESNSGKIRPLKVKLPKKGTFYLILLTGFLIGLIILLISVNIITLIMIYGIQ